MPGLAFLFKKGWHPLTLENQKKLFMAEEKVANTKKREEEAALEISKEKEMLTYEKLGEISERDPRTSSLKFMYSQPQNKSDKMNSRASSTSSSAPNSHSTSTASHRDDELVQSFYDKLTKRKHVGGLGAGSGAEAGTLAPQLAASEGEMLAVSAAGRGRTRLEEAVGVRPAKAQSQAEMEQRHPFLRNAPTEGCYTKDMQLHHKPFNEVVRNVKCLRCGEWGHKSGDRECVLQNNNPHDWARSRREDPLTFMQQKLALDKQKLVLRHGVSQYGGRSSGPVEEEEEEESDPEAEFLASLTQREKRLLLRRLQEIETGVQHVTASSSSSSDSSSDSSDSDSDSSDEDRSRGGDRGRGREGESRGERSDGRADSARTKSTKEKESRRGEKHKHKKRRKS